LLLLLFNSSECFLTYRSFVCTIFYFISLFKIWGILPNLSLPKETVVFIHLSIV
jgi:hypothetical protein